MLPVVGTAREQACACLESGESAHVRSGIEVLGRLDEDQSPVLLGAGIDLEDLASAVSGGLERFGARLDPLHRAPTELGGGGDQPVF